MSSRAESGSRSRSTRTSMPAENPRPSAETMARRTPASRPSVAKVDRSASIRGGSIRLRGGLRSRTRATPPATSTSSISTLLHDHPREHVGLKPDDDSHQGGQRKRVPEDEPENPSL